MGGGGTAGAVSFPEYIDTSHRLMLYGSTGLPTAGMLDTDVFAILNALFDVGGNPYSAYTFTDPSVEQARMQDRYDAWNAIIGSDAAGTDVTAALTAALAAVNTIGTQSITRPNINNSLSGADSALERAVEGLQANVSIDENALFESYLDTVVAALTDAGVLPDVDADAIVTAALTNASAAAAAALTAATNAASSLAIQDLVDAFATKLDIQKGRALRQYASGMADINAVHSSAFIFGMGIVHAEQDGELARFQAELIRSVFTTALGSFNDLYGTALRGRLDAAMGDARGREQVLTSAVQMVVGLAGGRLDYEKSFLQLFNQAFINTLQQDLQGQAQTNAERQRLLLGTMELFHRFDQQEHQQHESATRLQAEVSRLVLVSQQEHETGELDVDVKAAKWDIENMAIGANILAAPSGMAAVLPEKPSRLQSMMGGAVSGAGLGATIGGPPGAAIGGAIGAIAGIFG